MNFQCRLFTIRNTFIIRFPNKFRWWRIIILINFIQFEWWPFYVLFLVHCKYAVVLHLRANHLWILMDISKGDLRVVFVSADISIIILENLWSQYFFFRLWIWILFHWISLSLCDVKLFNAIIFQNDLLVIPHEPFI